jgi:hypothetical protein
MISKEAAMKRGRTILSAFALATVLFIGWSAADPASAQFACPPGYYYVPGYGCQVPNAPYVLPEYDGFPPVVEPFYYGGRRDFYGGRRDLRWAPDHGVPGHDHFGHGGR